MTRSLRAAGSSRQAPVIGITGNIGSGKSAVAAILSELGVLVIDADRVVHELYADPDGALVAAVVQEYGRGVLACDGSLDRAALGKKVFGDARALARLEALVHPAVVADVQSRIDETPPRTPCAIEAIKLIESDLVMLLDAVWLVVAEPETQIARLRKRGMPPREARRRLATQSSPEEKTALAQAKRGASLPVLTIENTGSLAQLRAHVREVWENTHTQRPAPKES